MTRWTRATRDRICGRCGAFISRGKPILLLVIAKIATPKVRCEACEGPAPPDLPALIERVPIPITPMAHILTGVGALPFDYKQAQVGREPGEEG